MGFHIYRHYFQQNPKTEWEEAADLLLSSSEIILKAAINGGRAFYDSLQQ